MGWGTDQDRRPPRWRPGYTQVVVVVIASIALGIFLVVIVAPHLR